MMSLSALARFYTAASVMFRSPYKKSLKYSYKIHLDVSYMFICTHSHPPDHLQIPSFIFVRTKTSQPSSGATQKTFEPNHHFLFCFFLYHS